MFTVRCVHRSFAFESLLSAPCAHCRSGPCRSPLHIRETDTSDERLTSATMISNRPVLVVGAGPVGLSAAAFLALSGTPVRVIDSNAGPTKLSKALVLWRRSIMTLDPLIPREHWLTVGCNVKGAYFGDEGAVVRHINLANPSGTPEQLYLRNGKAHELPAGCLVSQADVEAALVEVLQQKFGITVERNTTLASFHVSDDSQYVTCTLQSTDSSSTQEEQLEVSHLIGCDGARSAVRKQLGISFQGCTLDQHWWLADVVYEVQDGINLKRPQQEAERVPMQDSLLLCTSSVGVIGVIPVAGREGLVRIIWNADSLGPTQATLEDFQQLLLDHTRMQIKLTQAVWISEFKVNERQVERYVHAGGRVLLAGDAAHVHSPAGGQGMNTGIQDAANLAWKVALVVAGEAAAGHELLDTYQEERWPVGADVIRRTGVMLRSNTLRKYFVRMLRLLGLWVLMSLPAVRQRMAAILAEDDIAYPTSSLAVPGPCPDGSSGSNKHPASFDVGKLSSTTARAVWGSCRPGYAFPDVSVMVGSDTRPATDLLRAGTGCFGTLVVLGPAAGTTASSPPDDAIPQQQWPARWGHWPLHVMHVSQHQADSSKGDSSVAGAVDSWGLLGAAVGVGPHVGDVGVLVRPDGIVAAVGGPQTIGRWLDVHNNAHP